MIDRPLAGKTILITRAREQSADFSGRLRDLGAEVIEFPTIEIVPPVSWEALDRAIEQLASYDWILFTSVNGVHFFWQRLADTGRSLALPPSLKVCAIGPATAARLKEKGVPIETMPKEFVAEAVLEEFKKMDLRGKRLLLCRAKKARDLLPMGLRRLGAEVHVVEAYRTVKPRGGSKALKKILADRPIDVITFTSSSTVNHFMELLEKGNPRNVLRGMAIASIGPVTSKTVREWGLEVHVQPHDYTIPGLAQAIAGYFSPHVSALPSRGSQIEVVLFDLGNVILPFSHYQIAEKLAPFATQDKGRDPDAIFSYLFDLGDGAVNDYESGKVSTADFFQSLKTHLRLSISFETFVPIWNEIFTENREVSEIIRSLKGKKRLGLVSNTNALHFDYALATFPVLRLFDAWILSHEVGFKKPAPQIFWRAIAWAGILPESILYIDDVEGHVQAAAALGMQGIRFVSSRQLEVELSHRSLLPVTEEFSP